MAKLRPICFASELIWRVFKVVRFRLRYLEVVAMNNLNLKLDVSLSLAVLKGDGFFQKMPVVSFSWDGGYNHHVKLTVAAHEKTILRGTCQFTCWYMLVIVVCWLLFNYWLPSIR